MTRTISKSDRSILGSIELASSKSISNRILIIRALSETPFAIHRLANAKDTQLLDGLLSSKAAVLDAGAAGTTFRFLTAWLSLQEGEQVLTGTERMKQRPIGALVDALRKIGADIQYVENEGYPPLRIGSPAGLGKTNALTVPANISSQYISALLLIAPALPNGLQLTLEGDIVSRPYIEMTLRLMETFGATHRWEGNTISVTPQTYRAKAVDAGFTIEADWSAASYYYALAAIADEADIRLGGLYENSLQGDAVLAEMMVKFGVQTHFEDSGIRIVKLPGTQPPPFFEYDFVKCPDIAQTLAVVCAALGTQGLFTGLDTLRIKETDRIAALQTELQKTGVHLSKMPPRFSNKTGKEFYMIEGKSEVTATPVFDTYEDHRMAMAFAPLALLGQVAIADADVVEKSYPDFWDDFQKLGFVIV